MNLETITNILVDNAEAFRNRTPDMSMFPEAEVAKIYAAAAEGTLRNRDLESTGHYLILGKHWERLLELGVPFFRSRDEKEQEAGKHFLEILVGHNKLPEDIAIELANNILKNDGEYSRYRAAAALKAGDATERAEEVAYDFFNQGNLEDGESFLKVSGKKLTDDEITLFAGAALKQQNYKGTFELYESQSMKLPKDRAKVIANSDIGSWLFDRVVEYMSKNKNPFTTEEFKEFADTMFETGNHKQALKVYKKAGRAISSEEYRIRGEQILDQVKEIEGNRTGYSPGEVWPTVRNAFDYFYKDNKRKAKKRIARYADSLLDQEDFAVAGSNVEAFAKIYEMVKMNIPVNRALQAARISEEKEKYGLAAKFYAAAGMKDAAKRVGDLALRSDSDYQKEYGSREAFKAAGDKDGLAVAEFIERNLSRFK